MPACPSLLVVDDDRESCEIVNTLAEHLGVHCVWTTDAAVTIGLISEHHPDVVLLDLQMPQQDGIEVLRALAQADCEATIIFTSCMDSRVLRSAQLLGIELGLNMGLPLQKPVFLADLASRLAHLLPASSRGARVAAAAEVHAP